MKPESAAPRLNPNALSSHAHHWLAFSAGPDSLCLLHLLLEAGLRDRLDVIHIDHGLDSGSACRAEQARHAAKQLGMHCHVERLNPDELPSQGGPEAAARHARYARLQARLSDNDHVLTAHHGDDQIETFFLRLLRASGARGLSGMAVVRSFGAGFLARPILHWSRQEILDYLERHDLTAILDPTNQDTTLDRNYLRQTVLPQIEQRWPGYRSAVLSSIDWMASARDALEDRAEQDFAQCSEQRLGEDTIQLQPWLKFEAGRALELIRHWCRTRSIEAPPGARLQEWYRQCMHASPDRQPLLDWPEAQLRRWDDVLWLDCKPVPPDQWAVEQAVVTNTNLQFALPAPLGILRLHGSALPSGQWLVDSGQAGDVFPGEVIDLETHARCTNNVNELLRSEGIPPWRRTRWPRIRNEGQLLALGSRWLARDCWRSLESQHVQLEWKSAGAFNPGC